MKGTRPLDNDEIRSVSTCFTTNALTQHYGIDTSRFSTKKLVLTLLNFGLNKRWHFISYQSGLAFALPDMV